MKKNALGHMNPEKKNVFSFFKRIHFLALLLCILIAVVFWLVVKNPDFFWRSESTGSSEKPATVSETAQDNEA